nr:hypothetical protein LKV13_04370 [Borrelia sp. BU AG58]
MYFLILIMGCSSIPDKDFNFHNTSYIGKINYQKDSVIIRNYEDKLTLLGAYNPLTDEEKFKIVIHIQKKGLNLGTNIEDLSINKKRFDYQRYDAQVTIESTFKKSKFTIYPINSRELLTKIHDTSQGNYIEINFKDSFKLKHAIKIEKRYIANFLKDFDKEKDISKGFFAERIEQKKKEIEQTQLKEEYDESNRHYVYSMEIPHFFENPSGSEEDYEVFIISNYYPDEDLNVLFLSITLYSNQWHLFHSIYNSDNKNLKIKNTERNGKENNETKETLNIILTPQEILHMARDIDNNYILKLKAYGEKKDFTFEIYKPLLLTFLKEINRSIRSLQKV